MKTYEAAIAIQASPEKVWEILRDTANYVNWDPDIIRVEGQMALGERIKFFTEFNPDQAFVVKITVFEPNQKIVFTDGLPLGLFKSERTHTLSSSVEGKTLVHTKETFSGLLFPFFGSKIPDLTDSLNAFVVGLKQRAEAY